jgi:hypothetical protein
MTMNGCMFKRRTTVTTQLGDHKLHKLTLNAARLVAFAGLGFNAACVAPPGTPTTSTSNSFVIPGFFVAYGVSGGGTQTRYDASSAAALTTAVLADFTAAIAFCGAIDGNEYTVDCLSERLSFIAEKLPNDGDFAEMRSVIADASQQLGAIAGQSPSATLPSRVLSAGGETPITTTRPLRPVATETLAANLAAADAIIAEAQVTLLRSTSNSEERAISYQQVAAIVGESRVLLRSA